MAKKMPPMKMSPMSAAADDDKRWRAEADLDTLLRAAEIKADKARLAAAVAIGRERKKKLDSIDKM